jgi:hypothetical protein
MKSTKILRNSLPVALLLAVILILSSCTASKTGKTTSSDQAKLEYQLKAPTGYKYLHTSSSDQYMDVQGQSIAISAKTLMGFSTLNAKTDDNLVKFDVVIDTAGMTVASSMENLSQDLNLNGKSFVLTLDKSGKPVSYGDAANIEFTTASAGASDLASMFGGLMPIFSRNEAKPGDTWSSADTLTIKSKTGETTTITKGEHLFTEFVTLNGRRCAQINSTVTGNRNAKMNSQGMDLFMSFPFAGTEAIWFDTEEGVIVKYEASVKGDGEVEIAGMGMTIPVSMTTKTLLELVVK